MVFKNSGALGATKQNHSEISMEDALVIEQHLRRDARMQASKGITKDTLETRLLDEILLTCLF
jgi:hypothetical protein